MTMPFIRVAVRLGHQVNARNLSSVAQSGVHLTGLLIRQPQFSTRHAPVLSQFSQHTFYSTTPSGASKPAASVHPEPAPLEDLTVPLRAGTVGSVTPENSLNTMSTPPPPPPAGVVGKAKDYFRKGKEVVIQCKDGVKLLWVNKRITKELRKAQKEEGYQLTRREFQLVSLTYIYADGSEILGFGGVITKTDTDLKRMIPFGLVFLLATEYIPLIIIFAPQLIPSTCVTPSQLEGRRKKIHEKRSAMTEKLIRLNRREITKESLASYNSFITISKKYGEGFNYDFIDREHLASFCRFMGLNGFGPKFMLKKRLDKHMTYLSEDDQLLQKDGIDSMTFAELQLANEERGMRSLEVSKEHLEKSLAYWLKLSLSKDTTIPPALMVFSRMFLLHSTFKSDAGKK
ncbi:hypothetical protein BG011_005787 [Mortierella polycephala]|uniref:Letm1 RBD domain-containing protein n=1 Tax=Mortierella polycephala TaxID=41804 RepID=A0A9P6PUM7_9FUNG|nr:hypothetical protein BG011_005787 [Mortierella polycephala]